ncbi:hypothetical protein L198_02926 [Cryptococcus wingfieldii CBS 7118]|uniref:Very-long-chain (3R)-3-hydroxyacyl-CoA dehydratase n=1 Tax=Cryptococcus wingfieldii CBS 7118 TaxID=1295528 RepID=A0A1E3JIZ9_9TREE|nr:hypothetical protein L198_02926 [Cryptococcus wingfieldii CBS 7118]ODO00606.1 hypothetical protein L198_02926 [Cryptococcus wingfieldii CBS 7118]
MPSIFRKKKQPKPPNPFPITPAPNTAPATPRKSLSSFVSTAPSTTASPRLSVQSNASSSSASVSSHPQAQAQTPIFEKFSPVKPAPPASPLVDKPSPRIKPQSANPSSEKTRNLFSSSIPQDQTGHPKSPTPPAKEVPVTAMSTASVKSVKNARKEQEKERVERQVAQPSGKITPVKAYLIFYNAVSTLLWGYLLVITLTFLLTPRSAPSVASPSFLSTLSTYVPFLGEPKHVQYIHKILNHLKGSYDFGNLGWLTKWIQSLAVLEIVHAALGLVRSPVGTVTSQVFSRVYTVWGVVEAVPQVTHDSPLFTTMLLAWSIAEVVRYSFYTLSLLPPASVPSPITSLLTWLRYTSFLVLYPLGAGSEAFLSFSTLPPFALLAGKAIRLLPGGANVSGQEWGLMEGVRLVMFFVWWPSLFALYTYMLKQRKKVLGKGKTVGGVNKAR